MKIELGGMAWNVKLRSTRGNYFVTLKKEQRVIREDEVKNLQTLGFQLTGFLDKIRSEVEKIKKQQSIVNKILQKREQYGK